MFQSVHENVICRVATRHLYRWHQQNGDMEVSKEANDPRAARAFQRLMNAIGFKSLRNAWVPEGTEEFLEKLKEDRLSLFRQIEDLTASLRTARSQIADLEAENRRLTDLLKRRKDT